MTGTRRVVSGVLAVGLMLFAAGCGDDSSDDDGEDESTSEAPTSTTTTTHPSTEDDEEAAFDIVRNLEAETDRLSERLYGDPSVIENPDDPDLQRFEEIVSEEKLANVKDDLERLQGYAQVAASPGVYLDTYVYDIASVDADTIRYAFCSVQDMVMVDAEGNEVDDGVAREVQGIRQAHRENGIWRLAGTEDSDSEEIEPGSVSPGHCESSVVEDPDGGQP